MSDDHQTLAAKCLTQLEEIDIRPVDFPKSHVRELLEVAIHRMEGEFSDSGALSVKTWQIYWQIALRQIYCR